MPQFDNLLKACCNHRGGEPDKNLIQTSRDLVLRAEQDITILGKAAAHLPTLPPEGAAWLAAVFAATIERGEGVEQSAPAVTDLFLSWLTKLPILDAINPDEDDLPEPTPEQARIIDALPQLCQSLVAHLARLPERRNELAQDARLLKRIADLEPYSHGISWALESLRRRSGSLVVLHPIAGIGFRLRYENVSNCFHLFSLIQTSIGQRMPGGRMPDRAIAASARGQETEQHASDTAWWHYGDPRSTTADPTTSIWGELPIGSIPVMNGEQVILLWPPLFASREWDTGFFDPHLEAMPSDVVLEKQLDEEECRTWIEFLGLPRPLKI